MNFGTDILWLLMMFFLAGGLFGFFLFVGYQKSMFKEKATSVLLGILLIFALFLIFYSFYAPYRVDNIMAIQLGALSPNEQQAIKGQVGDQYGGLMNPFIAIAGVIITGLAFWVQYQANQEQRKQFKETLERQEKDKKEQQFESHVFKHADIYRENVARWQKSDKLTGIILTDRLVAVYALETYKAILKDVELFINYWNNDSNQNYILPEYETKLNTIVTEISLQQIEQVHFNTNAVDFLIVNELAYLILFYGVEDSGRDNIKKMLKECYNESFLESLTNILSYKITIKFDNTFEVLKTIYLNREKYDVANPKSDYFNNLGEGETMQDLLEINRIQPLADNEFKYKLYNGMESLFSHYYRHLNSAYKFIDQFKDIAYLDRWKRYAKLIRTQSSNAEQILFYLNSITILGRAWELQTFLTENQFGKNRHNNQLITKYDIIKNIPKGDREFFKIDFFYPNVEWEDAPMSDERNLERYKMRKKMELDFT
jgi:hypothetical protein